MSPKPRRHSYSEGMKATPLPHKTLVKLVNTPIPIRELAVAQRMLKGYAHASKVRDTFRMINTHNRKIKKAKKAKKVRWADQALGTDAHKPLPRRKGLSIMWSG